MAWGWDEAAADPELRMIILSNFAFFQEGCAAAITWKLHPKP